MSEISNTLKDGLKAGAPGAVKAATDAAVAALEAAVDTGDISALAAITGSSLEDAVDRQALVAALWERRDKLDRDARERLKGAVSVALTLLKEVSVKALQVAVQAAVSR